MNRTTPLRSAVVLALAFALVLGSVPAYGTSLPATVDPDAVPSHAMVGGVDLYSLSATDALTAIAAGSAVPTLGPIALKGDGHTLKFATATAVSVNAAAMLDQAYAATDTVTPFELKPVYSVKWSVISGWTAKAAKTINDKTVDARWKLSRKKLVVLREWTGHTVITSTTGSRIAAAAANEAASPSVGGRVVYAAIKTTKPKVTRANIGKAILVRLSRFSISLYRGAKVQKRYRCAVGMPGYSTPTGKWKVTGKVKWPSWHNPGAPWAANMPSVIGPGPSNPLGTRAIYLSAPGIRIHGTSKWRSIGHRASHGCLRMRRKDVENLYPRVPVGIPVWIIN